MTGKYWWEEPLARMSDIVTRVNRRKLLVTHISINEVHRTAEELGMTSATHMEVTFALRPSDEPHTEIKP